MPSTHGFQNLLIEVPLEISHSMVFISTLAQTEFPSTIAPLFLCPFFLFQSLSLSLSLSLSPHCLSLLIFVCFSECWCLFLCICVCVCLSLSPSLSLSL